MEFPEELALNSYYIEISSRKRLVELGQESTKQAYAGDLAAYKAKLDSNTDMIDYYADAIEKSKHLIEAIRNRENRFSSEESYYYNTVENYLVQYQQTMNQYNDMIHELQKQKDAAIDEIKQLEAQKADLQAVLEQNNLLSTASVSGGDANVVANPDIQQKLQNVEALLGGQKTIRENAESEIDQYNLQMSFALNSYQMESIAAIESSILNYEQNIESYKGAYQEYLKSQNLLLEKGTDVELGNLITQERHSVAVELENCRQSRTQLKAQIESLEQSVENATVRASISGTVNLATDLVQGDYLGTGIQTLSIIPDTDAGSFIVKSYVENKDIAKIHEGMKVTYEIAAYPAKEYGTVTGEVTFVSADLKVNHGGSAYYVVETSVKEEELRNRVGDEVILKVGMLCETKVVIEERSVLEVLIEKLFHITK